MPQSLLETQAFVLHRENFNENFIRFELFCPNNGKLCALHRLTKKNLTSCLPDLFDLATFQLSPAKQGDLLFLKDFHLNHRYSNIPKNYSTFHYACQWAKILSINLSHIDLPNSLFQLTQKTLDAFENSQNPASTYLKTLFLFTRQEGYPIKEDWLINLPQDSLNPALIALQTPLANQNLPSPTIERLIDNLHLWIRQQTDILLPHLGEG